MPNNSDPVWAGCKESLSFMLPGATYHKYVLSIQPRQTAQELILLLPNKYFIPAVQEHVLPLVDDYLSEHGYLLNVSIGVGSTNESTISEMQEPGAASAGPVEIAEHKASATVTADQLTHARHDPGHCLMPGLFRSIKKGTRKRRPLNITHEFGDTELNFVGHQQLGAEDLLVLQGLVAMAGPAGIILSADPDTDTGRQLRLALDMKNNAIIDDALTVSCTFSELAKLIGMTGKGGSQYLQIRDSVERLWACSIIVRRGPLRRGFRVLSHYASDERGGKLCIALNPLLATAVRGGGRHVRISMDEIRDLNSPAARILHQRLCGWIDPGGDAKPVLIDTLCEYVWPNEADSPPNKNTLRRQRMRIRTALRELVAVNWAVVDDKSGLLFISRPII